MLLTNTFSPKMCSAHQLLPFLDWFTFADDKISITLKLKFVLGRLENLVEKVESAGGERDTVVTITVWCMCLNLCVGACVCPNLSGP